ncbi:hypothetical protein JL721_6945 [Aureococcus anophagefferens]|nr:hypothetical protein JL721_6945 [Aureococcus anophagefferens]
MARKAPPARVDIQTRPLTADSNAVVWRGSRRSRPRPPPRARALPRRGRGRARGGGRAPPPGAGDVLGAPTPRADSGTLRPRPRRRRRGGAPAAEVARLEAERRAAEEARGRALPPPPEPKDDARDARDALKAHGEAPVDDEAEAPVELPELPVQDDDARDARDEVVAWVRAHAVSGTSNTIKEIYAAVADRFGVELTKQWKKLIKRVVTEALKDDDDDDDDDEAGEAPVEAPDDDLDAYDDDDDDAYEEDASVEAPDERGVSGESGDDDDDDDGLKIYDDCDDDDDDASFDEPDLRPKPKRTRDDACPGARTKTWTGGRSTKGWTTTWSCSARTAQVDRRGGYSQKCSDRIIIKSLRQCLWVKKLNCPCQVRVVHPADRPGVTYLQERLGHVHNFDIEMKTSKTLPVKIREIVAPMVLMTTAPKHKIWQLLEAKGVDVVNDFPPRRTTSRRSRATSAMRKKGKGKNAGTMGGLSQFLEDHLVGLDEVDELDDEHRVALGGSVIDADSRRSCWASRRHIVAGWLLKSENKDDITVIYDKTLSYVEALAPFEREQMRHSMEDNCSAIFSAVAPTCRRREPGNCYFHLMKNVRSKKNRFTSEAPTTAS